MNDGIGNKSGSQLTKWLALCGLALVLVLAAGACRDADDDDEEEPPYYNFVMDTPPDGASDVNPGVLLHWSIWNGIHLANSADLYFGTDPNPPFRKYFSSQDGAYYRPGPLEWNTTYYWRLGVTSPAVTSAVQSFTVGRDRALWTYALPAGQSVYDVNGTPVVLGSRVYQKSEKAVLHCLDAAMGSVQWIFSPSLAGSTAGSAPAAMEKVCFADNRIYCLNAASGALLWSAAPAKTYLGFHQPLLLGDRVFAFTEERISCLDAVNGGELWGSDRAKCSSLAAANGKVFVTTSDAGGGNFLECLAAETGAPLWSKGFGSERSSKAAAGQQRVFIGHGNRLYCLAAGDGAPIWEYITDEYAANPFAFDDKVLVATMQDRYSLLDAASGARLWQAELLAIPGSGHSTKMNGDPVMVNGSLVLADSSGYVYCLDMMNGGISWKYFVSTDMQGAAGWGDRIYVTGDDEILYCLDSKRQ